MKTLRLIAYPAVLCGVVIAVFAAATTYGLCPFDDELYIVPRSPFTDVSQSIWMPLTYLSYALDRALGYGSIGFHTQSLLWHVASSLLLYCILVRLFKIRFAAFIATLVWAIHPLRVESVVWIASRKDVISTFMLLAALHAWIGKYKFPIWTFVFLVLGAMAKPSVMVFPLFAATLDLFFTQRCHSKECWFCVIALSIGIAIEGGHFQGVAATEFSSFIPLWYRLLNAVASLSIYIHHTLWPEGLAVQCFMRYPLPPRVSLIGILITGGVGCWLVRTAWAAFKEKRFDVISPEQAGIALFFISFGPFLGIAGFGYHAFADRFTIIPALGLSLTVAALLDRFLAERKRFLAVLGCFVVFALAFTAFNQTQYWQNTKTLMGHTLDVDGERNVPAHRVLGTAAWESRDMENTYLHLKAAFDAAWNEPIRNHLLLRGHWLIEACYETGRHSEGEDFYFLMKKWNLGITQGEGLHPSFAAADILFDAYSRVPERIDQAQCNFAKLQAELPDASVTHAVGYRLAALSGDEAAKNHFLEACLAEPEIPNGHNREWARRVLGK